MENIADLKYWTEVTKGLYRFVLAPGACYEIHVLYYYGDWDADREDKLTAKSALYLVGQWYDHESKTSYFERECLEDKLPLFECLEAAKADYEKYHADPPVEE